MEKGKVIKKELKYSCYCCNPSIRGEIVIRKNCQVCNGSGFFKDEIYYHIANGICIDSDNLS